MQTSTSRILVLSVLFDSIVQRGERKRSHLGSLVRKFPDPVLASPWIPDRKQSVTPSFHAAFSVVGNGISDSHIWLFSLCSVSWSVPWPEEFFGFPFAFPFIVPTAISLCYHHLEKVRKWSSRVSSVIGAEWQWSCPGQCWPEEVWCRSAVCNRTPTCFPSFPDPGV